MLNDFKVIASYQDDDGYGIKSVWAVLDGKDINDLENFLYDNCGFLFVDVDEDSRTKLSQDDLELIDRKNNFESFILLSAENLPELDATEEDIDSL